MKFNRHGRLLHALIVLLMSASIIATATEADKSSRQPNGLINEQSPYLLQHAYNPVAWFPWGEAAFGKARAENKPLFISIGYSTCHWCHVMARESFENQEIADILNKHFISIKIDREERPDIDGVYMAATQLINGSGGWPMSVFVNHALEPFHAGTYYPPESSQGRTGFRELMLRIHELWTQDRERVDAVAAAVAVRIKFEKSGQGDESIEKDVIDQAYRNILASYDEEDGGFGNAPKFPRPGIFAFLNNYAKTHPGSRASEIMSNTLDRMARGGIFDQLGGGYHRYSVDAGWQVPHFEKMLYTQAMMASACFDAQAIANSSGCLGAATKTLDFVMREMTSPDGGFYSAFDADSAYGDDPDKHGEGVFYLWSYQELRKLLKAADLKLLQAYYGVRENGNIESDPFGEFENLNILFVQDNDAEVLKNPPGDKGIDERLAFIQQRLFDVRSHRPEPFLDDKIITAWNGLMIEAFVKGYQVTGDERYRKAAERAATFIRGKLFDDKKERLYRQFRIGKVGVGAVLEDYVFLVSALLNLHTVSDDKSWLAWAEELTDVQIKLFIDESSGGFFKSPAGDAHLLFREKGPYDSALPSANAIAAQNLIRLAGMRKARGDKSTTAEQRWQKLATQTIQAFGEHINNNPAACASMLVSYHQLLQSGSRQPQ